MKIRLLATGTVLLAVGVTLAAVVAEWFAAFDACLASVSCVAPDSVSTLSWFAGLLAIGTVLAVVGLVAVAATFRTQLTAESALRRCAPGRPSGELE